MMKLKSFVYIFMLIPFLTVCQDSLSQDNSEEFMMAIRRGDIEQVKLLISSGADINTEFDQRHTPLIVAIYADNLEITGILIDAGADVNSKTNDGETPLKRATMIDEAGMDRQEIIALLKKSGARAR